MVCMFLQLLLLMGIETYCQLSSAVFALVQEHLQRAWASGSLAPSGLSNVSVHHGTRYLTRVLQSIVHAHRV